MAWVLSVYGWMMRNDGITELRHCGTTAGYGTTFYLCDPFAVEYGTTGPRNAGMTAQPNDCTTAWWIDDITCALSVDGWIRNDGTMELRYDGMDRRRFGILECGGDLRKLRQDCVSPCRQIVPPGASSRWRRVRWSYQRPNY